MDMHPTAFVLSALGDIHIGFSTITGMWYCNLNHVYQKEPHVLASISSDHCASPLDAFWNLANKVMDSTVVLCKDNSDGTRFYYHWNGGAFETITEDIAKIYYEKSA